MSIIDLKDIPVFDGHNDVLLECGYRNNRPFFKESGEGHLDFPRMQDSNFAGGFFACFIPKPNSDGALPDTDGRPPLADPLDTDYAYKVAMHQSSALFRWEEESSGKFKVVRTVDDLKSCLETDTVAAIYHFEGAEAIDEDLYALDVFYAAGLRSIGPVWSRPTLFATGVPFGFPDSPDQGPGLTDAGKRLVTRCNELGIMLDVSHLNEKGFWDIEKLSTKPIVATHSAAWELGNSPRNLTDKQLDAIKASNGLVGVNYHIGFLREDGHSTEHTSLTEIVRHAVYIAERIGIEHVALGSDFDGATMPHDLGDVRGLSKLLEAFADAGFDKESIEMIAYKNWLRVLAKTW